MDIALRAAGIPPHGAEYPGFQYYRSFCIAAHALTCYSDLYRARLITQDEGREVVQAADFLIKKRESCSRKWIGSDEYELSP
jgi:hypothetical protein